MFARTPRTTIALIIALTTQLTAPPASAAQTPITAGLRITSGNLWCTVSFPDPISPEIVYTASHCYTDDPAVRRDTTTIGRFRPDIQNKDLDLIAIQLNSDSASAYKLCTTTTCQPLLDPIAPKPTAQVCKYGASTQETCGTIEQVWSNKFSITLNADHGDSGSPVYQQDDRGIHLVGMIDSAARKPGLVLAVPITAITTFLAATWGTGWTMN